MIDAQKENGPGRCGNTKCPEPNHCKGVADMSVPACLEVDQQAIALDFLHRAEEELKQRRQKRDYFLTLARDKGVTHQRIADVLGVTEGAVRAMLKRSRG